MKTALDIINNWCEQCAHIIDRKEDGWKKFIPKKIYFWRIRDLLEGAGDWKYRHEVDTIIWFKKSVRPSLEKNVILEALEEK